MSDSDRGTFVTEDQLADEVRDEQSRRGFLRKAAATGVVFAGASVAHAGKPTGTVGLTRKKSGKTAADAIHAAAAGKPAAAAKLPELYPNWNARNFGQIRADENDHVQFLLSALGSMARPKPNFQNIEQPDIVTFARTSFVLENTGVDAYLSAAPLINSKAYLGAAGSILTVEARHSGYLGTLFNLTPILFGHSRDELLPLPFLLRNAMPFIHDLNGGPPLSVDSTPSDANDIAILNVALALEFLEAEYYNVNVAKFFGV